MKRSKIFLGVIVFTRLTLCGSVLSFAQDSLFIENNLKAAIEVSKSLRKPIFVFATIDGCGPCKKMEREIFNKRDVQNLLNKYFVPIRINGQKEQGKSFATKNRIVVYPTLIFIKPDSEEIFRTISGIDLDGFTTICQNMLDSSKHTPALKRKFEKGVIDSTFLEQYIKVLSAEESSTGSAIDSLFKITKAKYTFRSIQYLNYLNTCQSATLRYFIDNRQNFKHLIDAVPYIESVFYRTTQRLFIFGDFSETEYRQLVNMVKRAKIFGWEDRVEDLQAKYVQFHKKKNQL